MEAKQIPPIEQLLIAELLKLMPGAVLYSNLEELSGRIVSRIRTFNGTAADRRQLLTTYLNVSKRLNGPEPNWMIETRTALMGAATTVLEVER